MERTEREQETRSARGEVEIEARVERVWKALTEARELERWFPLEAEVEPGPEGRIWMSWGNEFGGWSRVEVWEPPEHLRVAWVVNDEAPVRVTDFRLEGRGGRTRLRVVTSGFPADASWDDMVEGTRLGWAFELYQLKHYLERHSGEDRRVAFHRRRVALTREEAWDRLTGADEVEEALVGEVFDRTPSWQIAAVTEDPADGLLRLTIEPSHDEAGVRDVTLLISAWGEEAARVKGEGRAWKERLAHLFPEGRPLDAEA